jgi:hypothetical protein
MNYNVDATGSISGMQQSEKASQVLKMMMMMISSGCSRVPLSKLQQLLQCKFLAKTISI